MQAAVVIAQSSVQRPAVAKGFRGSGINTEIKKAVIRDEIFFAFIARLLIHTTNTRREFPAIELVGHVAQVVGQSM